MHIDYSINSKRSKISLSEIVCNSVTPSGISYVGTANQIIVSGNVISLSPVVTDTITNSELAITTLQNCVSSTIKNITSSTLSISTTNSNSCGRTLNIEAPINPIPLSEKSGIIENIVDWEVLPNNTTKSKNLVPYGLKIGDSLRRKIDKGLANSRFGIVVLSKEFIKKGWTNYELDGIITKVVTGEQILLPIWHNITKQEVIDFSPSLADKLARHTSTYTVVEIADEIANVINNSK